MSVVPASSSSTVPQTNARMAFQRGYQVSPIVLSGGLATNAPGGLIPILSLLESEAFATGLLSQGANIDLDNTVSFRPLPGSSLVEYQAGMYPYANQVTAANAMIAMPLRISLMMEFPARKPGDYLKKEAKFAALKRSLDSHIQQGGVFTVFTPAYLYTNCLLLNLTVADEGDSKQVQHGWRWDFLRPLLELDELDQALSTLLNKISSGVKVSGDPPGWSGPANAIGDPQSGVAPAAIPAAQSTPASGVGGTAVQPTGAGFSSGSSK